MSLSLGKVFYHCPGCGDELTVLAEVKSIEVYTNCQYLEFERVRVEHECEGELSKQ